MNGSKTDERERKQGDETGVTPLGVPPATHAQTSSGADEIGTRMRLMIAALVLPAGVTAWGRSPTTVVPTSRRSVAARMDHQYGQRSRTVPLTGRTLDAALKIRCDTTGAAYAVYWTQDNRELKAAGSYVAQAEAAGFVESSKAVILNAMGNGPIAQVKRLGQEIFVPSVRESTLARKELALQYGISQVGTSASLDTST